MNRQEVEDIKSGVPDIAVDLERGVRIVHVAEQVPDRVAVFGKHLGKLGVDALLLFGRAHCNGIAPAAKDIADPSAARRCQNQYGKKANSSPTLRPHPNPVPLLQALGIRAVTLPQDVSRTLFNPSGTHTVASLHQTGRISGQGLGVNLQIVGVGANEAHIQFRRSVLGDL